MARGLHRSALLLLAASAFADAAEIPKHWGGPRFAGKKVMVTGGDSGIGLAAVGAFYFECASVMMVGHNVEKTEQAWKNLTALPSPSGCPTTPKLRWTAVDTSNASAVVEMTKETVAQLGGLDVAVNNAGTLGSGAGVEGQIGDEGWLEYYHKSLEMKVNVDGTLHCMQEQLKLWKETKTPGVMVNVASICGETGYCPPSYVTSKWATIGFSKQAALHNAPAGIRINVLAPGAVNTPMLRRGRAEDDPAWLAEKHKLEASIPSRHIAEPWEMAGPITFLASDMSSYMNGQVLTADGGLTQASPLAKMDILEREQPEALLV
mmetsp:Transcript_150020/g.482142  ORF Transcript_150020/g.482142 Transcript_150020/m.482142 type:complete len:320 (+) Transcript_150020:80-1039(+)